MEPNKKFEILAENAVIDETVKNLTQNGFVVEVCQTGVQAKEKLLSIIPAGASVMNMTSMTLEAIGIATEITKSGKYDSVRNKLTSLDKTKDEALMRSLGAAPEWSLGSVHAITKTGVIMIASNTGSQLPAAAYAAKRVILVAGIQKIVENIDEGFKRIYEYSLPLESERAKIAYGVPGSSVNKILIINKEIIPARITVILVKEKLGF